MNSTTSPKISKEEFEQLLFSAQQLEQERATYQQQIDLLNNYYNDVTMAEQTLIELKHCKKAHNTLVPIGAGIFVYANIDENENVLVSVGAKVHIKKPLDEALANLRKRKEDIENQLISTKARYNEVLERLRGIEAILQSVG